MNELILLKRFILNSSAKNSEHIEAISWVNSLEQKINKMEAQLEQNNKAMKDGK